MNTRPILATLSGAAMLACLAPPAIGAPDPRLATRLYSPNEVVRIDGRTGVQAAIAFDENEHIENVAIGDSNAWQITPNKRANMLFVKPLAGSARTNMTVLTDRHTYYFDLVASPQARPLYVLRFSYPQEARTAAAPEGAGPLTNEEASLASGDGALLPADPAALNFAWNRKGKSGLLPARVYDDGASVYVSWAAGTPVPAILIKDSSGTEGPVNYAVRGDVIVIEGVPEQIVLRRGKEIATLDRAARPASQPAAAPRQVLAEAPASQGN
jgi:type IV secretion system protein VirB9